MTPASCDPARRARFLRDLDLARALADGRMTVRVDAPEVDADLHPHAVQGRDTLAPIAVVRGRHAGALGVGYSQADVVVAEMVDPSRPPMTCRACPYAHDPAEAQPASCPACGCSWQSPRKLTIAWWVAGIVERDALCAALNEAEVAVRAVPVVGSPSDRASHPPMAGSWGGGSTILGSPQGGSVLPLDTIICLARAAMNGGAS